MHFITCRRASQPPFGLTLFSGMPAALALANRNIGSCEGRWASFTPYGAASRRSNPSRSSAIRDSGSVVARKGIEWEDSKIAYENLNFTGGTQ
jgi:hypothetical protein